MMQGPASSSYSSSLSSPSSVSPGHPCHVPSPLPPGWQECVSKSTGRTYFWNQHTKKSQWDRPTKPAIPKQLSPVEDNPLTSWTQKNVRGKKPHADTENGKPAKAAEETKENQMDLLNDYLKKIQSGEATVEELATKYDNRIKTTAAVAITTSTAGKENETSRSEHKIDGQEENLVNGSESSSHVPTSSNSSQPRAPTSSSSSSSSPSRQPFTRQLSEESSRVIRQFSDSSQGTSVSVDNTPLPTRRAALGSTGSGANAASGGPANRLIARLRGRALKSVTPHQFFSNPSLHSVEETDIDTGQKTTKVLFGETNLDEVYKEKVLKAKSMMNLTPSSNPFGGGRCFKAKSLDPVFKESVPLSQLNGFGQSADDDSTLSEHERRFKKSLQNLHVPDWFSNSRFYRNTPVGDGRGAPRGGSLGITSQNKSSSSSSSSTFLTPNTPLAQRPPTATLKPNHYLAPEGGGGRNAATLPSHHARPPAASAANSNFSSPASNHRPDLTKSKSSDSHDTVPSDWTSKPSSETMPDSGSLTSPNPPPSTTSSSNPISPMSPIFANLKAGSPYSQRRGLLTRDLSADQTTSCSEVEDTNGSRGIHDKVPADASLSAFSNSDSLSSAQVNGHAKQNDVANVKTMHITGV